MALLLRRQNPKKIRSMTPTRFPSTTTVCSGSLGVCRSRSRREQLSGSVLSKDVEVLHVAAFTFSYGKRRIGRSRQFSPPKTELLDRTRRLGGVYRSRSWGRWREFDRRPTVEETIRQQEGNETSTSCFPPRSGLSTRSVRNCEPQQNSPRRARRTRSALVIGQWNRCPALSFSQSDQCRTIGSMSMKCCSWSKHPADSLLCPSRRPPRRERNSCAARHKRSFC